MSLERVRQLFPNAVVEYSLIQQFSIASGLRVASDGSLTGTMTSEGDSATAKIRAILYNHSTGARAEIARADSEEFIVANILQGNFDVSGRIIVDRGAGGEDAIDIGGTDPAIAEVVGFNGKYTQVGYDVIASFQLSGIVYGASGDVGRVYVNVPRPIAQPDGSHVPRFSENSGERPVIIVSGLGSYKQSGITIARIQGGVVAEYPAPLNTIAITFALPQDGGAGDMGTYTIYYRTGTYNNDLVPSL